MADVDKKICLISTCVVTPNHARAAAPSSPFVPVEHNCFRIPNDFISVIGKPERVFAVFMADDEILADGTNLLDGVE